MAIGLAFGGLALRTARAVDLDGNSAGPCHHVPTVRALVAAPILVLAPRSQRIRYVAAVVASAAVVSVGMLVVTSGRLSEVLAGTTATPSGGGTLAFSG